MDHSKLDFVGGATIGAGSSNGRPIQGRPVPPGTPRWGSKWKDATAKTYGRVMGIGPGQDRLHGKTPVASGLVLVQKVPQR